MAAIVLPEPSGNIVYKSELRNSYGEQGCYYVGKTEIEKPSEDVQHFAQMLADALAALDYETHHRIDVLAAAARAAYYSLEGDEVGWETLSENYKDRWRAVVRLILDDAP